LSISRGETDPGFGATGAFLQTVAVWTLNAALVATVAMRANLPEMV
jgi:hypothetical protein